MSIAGLAVAKTSSAPTAKRDRDARAWIEAYPRNNGKTAWVEYSRSVPAHALKASFEADWKDIKKNPQGRPAKGAQVE